MAGQGSFRQAHSSYTNLFTNVDSEDEVEESSGSEHVSRTGEGMAIEEGAMQRSRKAKGGTNKAQRMSENVQSLPNGVRPQKPAPKGSTSLPAKDHRHRPGSLWCPPSGVTRLATRPDMFCFPDLLPTTSSEDFSVAHRVKKAWMYCVSAGPCWELLEDRGFYKEEYFRYGDSSRNGRVPKPLVYPNLPAPRKHDELLVG